ncbi:ATP synthase F1 subunit epsilon [bacterium I07]|nr:ATP synthase F1 subunit epsilon [bacterium G20]OVE79672.1 ATP synthase F1 subunit epsilon [bacterium I07]
MHFQLVSVSGTKFDDDAYEVLVPTRGGVVGIFEHHMPLISAAQPGILSVRKKSSDPDSSLEHFAINGGVVEVDGHSVRFIADDVTTSDEVSEQEAATALKRAEELVKSADSQTALHEAHHLLRHSSAKLHLAQLKKRHHR